MKNWQLQSCDGLSLPFLINWLAGRFNTTAPGADTAAGDVTNLVGCVLTDQLPFQVRSNGHEWRIQCSSFQADER